MSEPKANPRNGTNKNAKRNLPSWMSTADDEGKSHGEKSADASVVEETKGSVQANKHDGPDSSNISTKNTEKDKRPSASCLAVTNFSKLLEGVVFVLSGFVNPERSVLRSQALEMGAEYQPDWNSGCTLLVCAFPNTPKFRQVEADCGTIVSKEWISECYKQKKLVDIESYLMNAGKPWRRQHASQDASKDLEYPISGKSHKQKDRGAHASSSTSVPSESRISHPSKVYFSRAEMKKWAVDDLNKTISWLESQEEKPEASEIKKIAAEGILTCLEDAIVALSKKQDIQETTEQWQIIPRVVEELIKLESNANGSTVPSKEQLCKEAKTCKQVYELEFSSIDNPHASEVKKKPRTGKTSKGRCSEDAAAAAAVAYDSDDTIEMTEEEIEHGYNNVVASRLGKH